MRENCPLCGTVVKKTKTFFYCPECAWYEPLESEKPKKKEEESKKEEKSKPEVLKKEKSKKEIIAEKPKQELTKKKKKAMRKINGTRSPRFFFRY